MVWNSPHLLPYNGLGPAWHGWVLSLGYHGLKSGYHGLKSGYPPGCVIWRLWGKIYFRVRSCYWQRIQFHSVVELRSTSSCRLSAGATLLSRPPSFLDTWPPSSSSQQQHLRSLTSSSAPSQRKLSAFKGLVWLSQIHFDALCIFFFGRTARSLQDLSSPTRDWT